MCCVFSEDIGQCELGTTLQYWSYTLNLEPQGLVWVWVYVCVFMCCEDFTHKKERSLNIESQSVVNPVLIYILHTEKRHLDRKMNRCRILFHCEACCVSN